jgi:predicted acyltransferase
VVLQTARATVVVLQSVAVCSLAAVVVADGMPDPSVAAALLAAVCLVGVEAVFAMPGHPA